MSGEPEETVVFNYLVEEFVQETPASDKQEDSFDENQNSKSNKQQGTKRKRSTEKAAVSRKREPQAARRTNKSGGAVARKGKKAPARPPKTVKVNGTTVKESEDTVKLKNLETLSVCNGPDVSIENITIKIENFEDESTELCAGKINGKSETSLIGGDNVGMFLIYEPIKSH